MWTRRVVQILLQICWKYLKKDCCTVSIYADGSLIRRASFCTVPNVLLLIKSNKQNKRKNETGNIRKGQLSVSMKSGATFLSIQKLSLIWILLWSKQLCWKQELVSHYEILTIRQNIFTQYDANVTNNPKIIVRSLN